MANKVFANGREISCKSGAGKSICAFPDVCLSPPSPPAGPVPIPYPNTGMDSDTTGGSKKVKISGKEVMLKDKSSFKKSTGDEAATKSLGMGVVTHQIQGKVYFNSWSMDVKIEGENAVRHLDLTTHNHMSKPGNSPPWPFAARVAMAAGLQACEKDREEAKAACNPWEQKAKCPDSSDLDAKKKETRRLLKANKKGTSAYRKSLAAQKKAYQDYSREMNQDDCHRKLKCFLTPYKPSMCCPPQTPHHLVDVSSFTSNRKKKKRIAGCSKYDDEKAPCVCAEGNDNSTGSHGLLHLRQREYAEKWAKQHPGEDWALPEAIDCGVQALMKVFPSSGCRPACIEAQLKREHEEMGIEESTPLRRKPSGARDQGQFDQEWAEFNKDLADDIAKKGNKYNAKGLA